VVVFAGAVYNERIVHCLREQENALNWKSTLGLKEKKKKNLFTIFFFLNQMFS
jgi:hypothetical protein